MASREPDVRLGITYDSCTSPEGIPAAPGDVYDVHLDPIEGRCAKVRLDVVAFVLSGRPGIRAFEVETERGFLRGLLSLSDLNPLADSSDALVARVMVTEPIPNLGNALSSLLVATACGLFPGGDVVYELRCVRWTDSVFPDGADWRQMLGQANRLEASAASDSPLAAAARDIGDAARDAGVGFLLPAILGAAALALLLRTFDRKAG